MAAFELRRDDGNEATKWGPHLRPVNHLVVRPPVELQKGEKRFTRVVGPADVALLPEEQCG